MKPSSAIALVSYRLGAATPLAFFFSQPVTNMAVRTQNNTDAIAFEILVFIRLFSIEFEVSYSQLSDDLAPKNRRA